MSIINITLGQTGLVGVLPSLAYINTSDPIATVTTTGYLNKEVANGAQFSLPCIAAVSTQETPTAAPLVAWYQVQHVGTNWSLVIATSEDISLANGLIFVGNASNIATAVAMSGDVTISNAGVTTIATGAITNAKVNAAAAIAFSKLAALPSAQILVGSVGNVATAVAVTGDVTIGNTGVTAIGAGKVLLAMLGSGISPQAVIKFSNQYTTTGGAAAEAITVTGAVAATDRAYVQVVSQGTNTVTVLKAVVTTNTLTVTFSGDPGSDCIINYQLIRAAS